MEPVGVDVGFEMMDGVKRLVPENGESASGECADEKRTEQAGSVGDGDVVDIVFREVSARKGLMNDGEDGFEMGTGGDFGNDATVSGENVNLRNDDVAQNLSMVANDGGGGFVARTFDGENIHGIIISYLREKG